MKPNVTSLERAFELAVSGDVGSIEELRRKLKLEGYDQHHVSGRSLQKQLRLMIAKAAKPSDS